MRNLELKVATTAAVFAAARVAAAGFGPLATMRQRDTYFATPRGRLKLREIGREDGEREAELIGYDRPDDAGARWSVYHRAAIAPDEVAALTAALTVTLGVRSVVEKTRTVSIAGRTRIHLDEVAGIGRFVELETVVGEADGEEGAGAELTAVARALGIDGLPPIAGSYGDMIDSASGNGREGSEPR
jgi:adenylate cyclase class IV